VSYTQIYYHIVFSTKNRAPVLAPGVRKEVFGYLWGILKDKKCHLYRMGGVEDHIHILTHLHPTVALAVLIRDLKTSSTAWIKEHQMVPEFPGWQAEYAAFTKSHADRLAVIEYIKGQEEHHRTVSFMDELKALLREEGIAFEERYLA
jgi:REP element-mobilizing transposase RayT